MAIFLPSGTVLSAQLVNIPIYEKDAGAEIRVAVGRIIVRVEVEQPIVRVVVVVAADISRAQRRVRVDAAPGNLSHRAQTVPEFLVT